MERSETCPVCAQVSPTHSQFPIYLDICKYITVNKIIINSVFLWCRPWFSALPLNSTLHIFDINMRGQIYCMLVFDKPRLQNHTSLANRAYGCILIALDFYISLGLIPFFMQSPCVGFRKLMESRMLTLCIVFQLKCLVDIEILHKMPCIDFY